MRIAVVDAAAEPFPNYWLRLFPANDKAGTLSLFCSSRDGKLDALVRLAWPRSATFTSARVHRKSPSARSTASCAP